MPRRGENIYKRKDGRWEARYIKDRSVDGKAIYGYLYARSYRDAKKLLQNCQSIKHATSIPLANPSGKYEAELFGNIAREWFESKSKNVKESTSNKYANLLESYILPIFGTIRLSDLTHVFIESQCNELLLTGGEKGTGLSPKTVSDILSVIRNILKYSAVTGRYAPCDACSIHIKRVSNEMRVLSRNEQDRLCQYLYREPNAYNVGILICLFTGIRVGELCALKWEDVSLSEHTIRIHQTMQRLQDKSGTNKKTKVVITSPKSSCSIRVIPIPHELVQIISTHKKTSTGYLLTNSTQTFIEPRTMQNKFKLALKSSAIDSANFHALRHTFATRCVELGFDVKSLSEILGHASVNITMNRYVHPSMDLKKENMQKLSELLAVK